MPTDPYIERLKGRPPLACLEGEDMTYTCPKSKVKDYIHSSNDADRRLAQGQEQRQCVLCKKWFWYNERKGHVFESCGKDSEGV